MRPEKSVRAHLENLRWAQQDPCDCSGTEHEGMCYQGYMMMTAVIKTLEWALGDNDDIGEQVEQIAANRARN